MSILPVAVGTLLLLSGLLAASETALFALSRMERHREELPGSIRAAVDVLMRRPFESLIVIIGLNETLNVFAECLGTTFLLLWLGRVGAYLSVPVMLVLVLVLADITPKTFALGFPAGMVRLSARPLALLTGLLRPLTRRAATLAPRATRPLISEAEFKALLRVGEDQGQVKAAERELIHRVFEFEARRVADVMTPRERVFALDTATPFAQLVAEVAHSHYSRVPLYRGRPDNIIGILSAKELAARRLDPAQPRLERLLRRPHFVPPGKTLGELFDEMRRERFQLAVVVNELGRLLGLLTLEDVLEELFGELKDEFETEGPELSRLDDGGWLVSGAVGLDRVEGELGGSLGPRPAGPARTLSAMLLRTLGRVPRPGEKLRLGDFEATVENVRGATIELVRLERCT